VGDKSSRKRSFWMATATYGIFTLLTGLAPSWQWVAAFRFLSGFGIGGVLVTTTILVSEAFRGKKRAVFLGVLSISIPLGIFSAGLLNYWVAYWRSGFYVGLLPLALALIAIFTMREDTHWRQGESEKEALPASFRTDANSRRNLFVGSVIFGTALIGLWATFSWMPYWIESMALPQDSQKQAAIAMMLMGGGGLTGGFVSGWITHRLGVKNTMLICFGICYLVAFTLFKLTTHVSPALFFQIALLAFFFGVSQGTLSVYIPELFPPRLSATATGLCFNIGRVFTAIAVFYLGTLVHLLGGFGNAIFIFSFVFAIGFLFTAFSKSQTYSTH
jgi:MFS family permease